MVTPLPLWTACFIALKSYVGGSYCSWKLSRGSIHLLSSLTEVETLLLWGNFCGMFIKDKHTGVRHCGFWFEGLRCSKQFSLDYWFPWDMLLDSWAFASCDRMVWQELRMLFRRCLILDRASSVSTKHLTGVMTQRVLCKPPREHSV